MTLTIVGNAILCAAVLVVIVGGLAWAIATQHRDRVAHVATRPSSDAAPALDRYEVPQRETDLALV